MEKIMFSILIVLDNSEKSAFFFYQVGAATVIKVVAEQLTKWLFAIIWEVENIFNILEHPTNAIGQDVI